MPRKPTVPDPAKQIPAKDRTRQTEGRFRLRADGAMTAWTRRSVDTLHLATDNLPLPLQRLDPLPPMIADMHLATAVPTHAISHIQKHSNQRRVVQPPMSHRFGGLHPPMDAGNPTHQPPQTIPSPPAGRCEKTLVTPKCN